MWKEFLIYNKVKNNTFYNILSILVDFKHNCFADFCRSISVFLW